MSQNEIDFAHRALVAQHARERGISYDAAAAELRAQREAGPPATVNARDLSRAVAAQRGVPLATAQLLVDQAAKDATAKRSGRDHAVGGGVTIDLRDAARALATKEGIPLERAQQIVVAKLGKGGQS